MNRFNLRRDVIPDPDKITRIQEVDIADPRLLKEFIPVSIQDISCQELLPFSVYFPFMQPNESPKFVKIVSVGNLFSSRWKTLFKENNIEHVYVHVNEFDLYARYINTNLSKALVNPYLSRDKKNEILYRNASYVMQRVLNDPRSGKNIQMGIDFMETFSQYVVKNEITASMLVKLFSKHYELFSHSIQVAFLTAVFCRFLNKDTNFILLSSLGALFHDVGKVEMPPEILLKRGELSDEEWSVIKCHPELGVKILESNKILEQQSIEVVLQHHEKADGSGYPYGLTIDEISPMAQVVHIVDCYDAMTTERVYKMAMSPFEALKTMTIEMKQSFNKKLLEKFIVFLGY